jgi:transcriptional regulator with XRE-family HTH domain
MRKALGFSRAELADLFGVTLREVAMWEREGGVKMPVQLFALLGAIVDDEISGVPGVLAAMGAATEDGIPIPGPVKVKL